MESLHFRNLLIVNVQHPPSFYPLLFSKQMVCFISRMWPKHVCVIIQRHSTLHMTITEILFILCSLFIVCIDNMSLLTANLVFSGYAQTHKQYKTNWRWIVYKSFFDGLSSIIVR